MQTAENRWIPDGFHFLGPEETKSRERLVHELTSCMEARGFSRVTLPSFDYSQSFSSRLLAEEKEAVLRVRDQKGDLLSPGVDLTLQAVKGMALRSHWEENQNIYYIGKKIRDTKKRNASLREILQVGAECLGDSSPIQVRTLLSLLQDFFSRLGIPGQGSFVFGHARLMQLLFAAVGDAHPELGVHLYRKNQSEIQSLARTPGLEFLNSLARPYSWEDFSLFYQSLESALGKQKDWEKIKILLDEIRVFMAGFPKEFPVFHPLWDPSLVRELNYYTGTMFQIYFLGFPEPIVVGGVYDDLYESFSGKRKPACGFAVQIDFLEAFLASAKGKR